MMYIPYPREREPMGGAPYINNYWAKIGGWADIRGHLYAKERPGKLPTLAS